MNSVVIRDETMTGEAVGELTIQLPAENTTVLELIRSRVFQEVKDANLRAASTNSQVDVLVQPTDAEVILNGVKSREPSCIDWEDQLARAVDAFDTNRVMILVDDRQVTSLDEEIVISPSTSIRFLRLTMLMGG